MARKTQLHSNPACDLHRREQSSVVWKKHVHQKTSKLQFIVRSDASNGTQSCNGFGSGFERRYPTHGSLRFQIKQSVDRGTGVSVQTTEPQGHILYLTHLVACRG